VRQRIGTYLRGEQIDERMDSASESPYWKDFAIWRDRWVEKEAFSINPEVVNVDATYI